MTYTQRTNAYKLLDIATTAAKALEQAPKSQRALTLNKDLCDQLAKITSRALASKAITSESKEDLRTKVQQLHDDLAPNVRRQAANYIYLAGPKSNEGMKFLDRNDPNLKDFISGFEVDVGNKVANWEVFKLFKAEHDTPDPDSDAMNPKANTLAYFGLN